MKCVCPMGGDRTCPDDCPLAVWASLTPSDRKTQRKSVAEKLYSQNFTMEQIATQLGVTHGTISRDLREFVHDAQIKKPAQTASNPKGAGRPKNNGTKSSRAGPKPHRHKYSIVAEEAAAALVLDKGKTRDQAAVEAGVSAKVVQLSVAKEVGRREALAEPLIDRSELSLTAQEKLDVAIRQHKRALDIAFEQRVRDMVNRRLDEIILPHWKEKIAQAQELYARRKALMDKTTFNAIRRALHPDSRNSITDTVLAEAFDTFMSLEKYLLNEKDSPTEIGNLPSTVAEWDKMRKRPKKRQGGKDAPARRH